MRILALDLGKYKSVAGDYEAETGRHRFSTTPTNPKENVSAGSLAASATR